MWLFKLKNISRGLNRHMKCPMCKGDTVSSRDFPPKPLPLNFCGQCLGAFFATNMSESQLSDFYNLNYDHYLHEAVKEFESGNFESIENQLDWVLQSIADSEESFDTVIEYGSSYPVLSARLKQIMPNVEFICVEPNEEARIWGRAKGIVGVSNHKDLSTRKRKMFVVFNHVLEHLPNPSRVISELYSDALPGSVGIGTVPNWNSLIARLDESEWEWFAYPEHLNYFTPIGMTLMIKRLGLQLDTMQTLNESQKTIISGNRVGINFSTAELEVVNESLLGNELRFKFTVR